MTSAPGEAPQSFLTSSGSASQGNSGNRIYEGMDVAAQAPAVETSSPWKQGWDVEAEALVLCLYRRTVVFISKCPKGNPPFCAL